MGRSAQVLARNDIALRIYCDFHAPASRLRFAVPDALVVNREILDVAIALGLKARQRVLFGKRLTWRQIAFAHVTRLSRVCRLRQSRETVTLANLKEAVSANWL